MNKPRYTKKGTYTDGRMRIVITMPDGSKQAIPKPEDILLVMQKAQLLSLNQANDTNNGSKTTHKIGCMKFSNPKEAQDSVLDEIIDEEELF